MVKSIYMQISHWGKCSSVRCGRERGGRGGKSGGRRGKGGRGVTVGTMVRNLHVYAK